jgi:hypothetical protein
MRSLLLSLPFSLSLSLSVSLLGTGCVAEEGAGGGDPTADPADQDGALLSSMESALCGAGTTPPATNWTHNFATDPDQIRSISGYGTDSCANYVVRLNNGVSPTYEQGTISIYLTGAVPTTAESCVGTSLTVRKWKPPVQDAGWIATTTTTHGEWTATGCEFPNTYSSSSYWTSGVRFEMSAMRSYCPAGGGPWCVLQYGLPLKVKVKEG